VSVVIGLENNEKHGNFVLSAEKFESMLLHELFSLNATVSG